MKHNPFRMQYDALREIEKEVTPDQFAYMINYVWYGFDDLTHDGYSVVDYEEEGKLNFDYGDVLQHCELDELRGLIDPDMRDILEIEGPAEDPDASMEYMYKLASTVDWLYEMYGPFYARFGDGDMTIDFNPLSGPYEDADLTHVMPIE